MTVGVVTESFPGERRVALVPATLPSLTKIGVDVVVQSGAGAAAGFSDAAYHEKGARIAGGREDVFAAAELILQVRTADANPINGRSDLTLMRNGQIVIGLSEPLSGGELVRRLASQGVTSFSMEMMPRISRAQTMDVLSSMATISGYKAVLLAASASPRLFPMLMTAAGTITPARVLVIGAGVAGLQAIATARRLGARLEAYDVRPAVKERVQSLGARFLELPLETGEAEDQGGYARAQDEAFYRRQREMMARAVATSDVVISTAAIPGKKAPVLITGEMVAGMSAGSVIVDLAAERGGNCDLTRPDETVDAHGVIILGPTNLPATVPYHASQMYARNISTFVLHLLREKPFRVNREDEITRETLITHDGQVVHPRVREALGLAPAEPVHVRS